MSLLYILCFGGKIGKISCMIGEEYQERSVPYPITEKGKNGQKGARQNGLYRAGMIGRITIPALSG
jgi:hypothetical protein